MIPHYTISNDIGSSGGGKTTTSLLYRWNFLWKIISTEGKAPNLAVEWVEQVGGKRNFNPFRDLSHGGTKIYFRGKNRWIDDWCLLGWLMKKIYS